MIVPFADLRSQHRTLHPELRGAFDRVLASGRFTLGLEAAKLERALASRVGVGRGLAVSSGTDALIAALLALEIGPGDRVITTPYSFVASAMAIVRVGAIPIFADIDPATFNLDPEAVSSWLERHSAAAHTVKAVLAVHLFGQCCDVAGLLAVCERHGIALVEDLAQSLDAGHPTSDGSTARAGAFGSLGCLSFYPTKNLGAIGEAGLILTDDPELAERVSSIRNQGASTVGRYERVGGNFRMDELQAALLSVKLEHLDGWVQRRRALAARYDDALRDRPSIVAPPARWGRENHVYHQYVVRLPGHRERVRAALGRAGIETRVYYPSLLHQHGFMRGAPPSQDEWPVAQAAVTETLALPIHPFMTDEQQAYVIDRLLRETAG